MNTNTNGVVKSDESYTSDNHNETLVRAKDLTPKGEIKGAVTLHDRRGR